MTTRGVAITRAADLGAWIGRMSAFLFGPRQTGKSFLIRQSLPGARIYDLLDSSVYVALSRHPGRLAEELEDPRRPIVIDEI